MWDWNLNWTYVCIKWEEDSYWFCGQYILVMVIFSKKRFVFLQFMSITPQLKAFPLYMGTLDMWLKVFMILGRVPMRRLVYRVQPLPQSMLPLVWDFGQLKTEVEEMYIKQMVRRYVSIDHLFCGTCWIIGSSMLKFIIPIHQFYEWTVSEINDILNITSDSLIWSKFTRF